MLGDRLVQLRKEKKMTQQAVADLLHISRGTYAQYEIERRVPEYATLERMADFYEVSLDYLVGRTDDKKRILADSSRKLIDMIDQELTDEEIMDKMKFRIDGIELSEDDVKLFVALVRSKRAMSKQGPAELGASKNNL